MKLRLFLSLTLAVVLCLYGCTKTVYVIETSGTTETPTDGTGQDGNGSGDSNSGVIYDDAYFSEPGDGTKENPYSVSQAIEIINSGAYEPRMIWFVKGVVAYIGSIGIASREGEYEYIFNYCISEDGKYVEGACVYMYNGTGLNGELFSSMDALSAGDKVMAYGYLWGYDDIPEILHNKLYYLNGEFGDLGEYMEEGDGTKENPYTVSQAVGTIYNGMSDPTKGYYVKGIVFGAGGGISYSDGTYRISYSITEDGDDFGLSDYSEIQGMSHAWGLYIYYSGEKFAQRDALQIGDQVIVYGKFVYDDSENSIPYRIPYGRLYCFNGEYEDLGVYEYLIELGDGTRENPYTVPQAVEAIENGSYDPDKGYYVKGIVTDVSFSGDFDRDRNVWVYSYYISESGLSYIEGGEICLYIYKGASLGGERLDSYDILRGGQAIVYGKLTSSNGQPEMIDGQLVYLNGETAEIEE